MLPEFVTSSFHQQGRKVLIFSFFFCLLQVSLYLGAFVQVSLFPLKTCQKQYNNLCEDPLWSSGHDIRLPNGKAVVRIRGSANAFEPKRIQICDHEASTPGESCGSSTR